MIGIGAIAEIGEQGIKALHHNNVGSVGKKAIGKVKAHASLFGFAAGAADLAFSVGSAKKGQALQSAASSLAGSTGGAIGGKIGQAIGAAIPLPFASTAFSILGGLIGDYLPRSTAGKAIGSIIHAGNQMTKSHFGGNYIDTDYAYTMRQRAASEMGSSLLNARKFLGSEARLLHS